MISVTGTYKISTDSHSFPSTSTYHTFSHAEADHGSHNTITAYPNK